MSRAPEIILLDDNRLRVRVLVEQIRRVVVAEPIVLEDFATLAGRQNPPTLLIVSLASEDIIAEFQTWRANHAAVPTMLLIAAGMAERTEAIPSIARFVRPIRLAELMQAIIGLIPPAGQSLLSLGAYWLDQESRQFIRLGGLPPVRLTEKEVAILRCLGEAQGRIISRENLLAMIWRYAPDSTTHTVETHIYRLRQKLELEAGLPNFLLSDDGGYRLNSGGAVLRNPPLFAETDQPQTTKAAVP